MFYFRCNFRGRDPGHPPGRWLSLLFLPIYFTAVWESFPECMFAMTPYHKKKKKKSVRYLDGKQKLYSQSWSYKHSRLSTKQKHTQTPTSPTPPALLKKSDWTHRCSFHSSWLVEKFEVLDATIYYLSLLKENKSTEILLRFLRTVYVWRLYVCADTYSIVLRFSL